ncbi:MAG: hypothetical protein K2M95_01395, partial [Clostridiales bacterium]|nr:hypothetical protein [Clostridiales bacterium]
ITIISEGEKMITPMPESNSFACKFVKQKTREQVEINGKTKKKKIVRFGVTVGDVFFELADDHCQKIFAALGITDAFKTELRLECGAYDVKVSDHGIAASVTETLDYGKEKFLKCAVGDNTVFVKADDDVSGNIYLLPDFEKIGLIETQRGVKII